MNGGGPHYVINPCTRETQQVELLARFHDERLECLALLS
jgi:hypothetical protein